MENSLRPTLLGELTEWVRNDFYYFNTIEYVMEINA